MIGVDRPESPVDLVELIVRLHEALDSAGLPHAFGGALALAWCIPEPRATADIDLNVFVSANESSRVLAALPAEVAATTGQRLRLERDGQVRLWWAGVPVDVFLATNDYHGAVGQRIVFRPFAGAEIPFLACRDLAVFKAFFDRSKDWVDIEQMVSANSINVSDVTEELAKHLGPDDHRIAKLKAVRSQINGSHG